MTFPTIKGEAWVAFLLGPVLEWSFCFILSDYEYRKVFSSLLSYNTVVFLCSVVSAVQCQSLILIQAIF